MAFPSQTGSQPNTLETAWATARQLAAQVKNTAQNALNVGSALDGRQIIALASTLSNQYTALQALAAVPGLAAYAQSQMNNPTLDVAGAFNAMTTAMVNTVTWIMNNFPKDTNGNLLYLQFTGQGQTVATSFGAAALAPLMTLLQTLVSSID